MGSVPFILFSIMLETSRAMTIRLAVCVVLVIVICFSRISVANGQFNYNGPKLTVISQNEFSRLLIFEDGNNRPVAIQYRTRRLIVSNTMSQWHDESGC